jgi:hypothetical protein
MLILDQLLSFIKHKLRTRKDQNKFFKEEGSNSLRRTTLVRSTIKASL